MKYINNMSSVQILDKIYDTTVAKYGKSKAKKAIFWLLSLKKLDRLPDDRNVRIMAKEITRGYNTFHILGDYALASFQLNNKKMRVYPELVREYAMDYDGMEVVTLNRAIQLTTLALRNPYEAVNLLDCNSKVKDNLIVSLILERYGENKRSQLDSVPDTFIIKYKDGKERREHVLSKGNLDSCVQDMNRDLGINSHICRKKTLAY